MTFEMAKEHERKVKLLGVKPRAFFGLPCQCSATELQLPPTTTPQSCPYIASVLLLMREIIEQITAEPASCDLLNDLPHQQWYTAIRNNQQSTSA